MGLPLSRGVEKRFQENNSLQLYLNSPVVLNDYFHSLALSLSLEFGVMNLLFRAPFIKRKKKREIEKKEGKEDVHL